MTLPIEDHRAAARQAEEERFTPDPRVAPPPFVVVQQPPEPWVMTYVKRGIGGLFLTGVVSIIANQGGFKWGAVMASRAVIAIFDRKPKPPAPVEATIDGVEKAAAGVEERIDSLIGKVAERTQSGLLRIPLAGAAMLPGLFGTPKSPEQIEAEATQKEADRERRLASRRNELLARADALKLPHDPDWPLEKLEIEVGAVERQKKEAPERKLLQTRAEKLGVVVDADWDIKTFRDQVKDAEEAARKDVDFQARHRAWELAVERWEWNRLHSVNAICPTPECGNPMRIPDGRIKGKGVCPKCTMPFACSVARARFPAPPRPREPVPGERKKGLLGRIFG